MSAQTSPVWQKLLTGLLAAYYTAIAMHMLLAPEHWYGSVPGVAATGPINVHFVRDIGAAFLMSGAAFAIYSKNPAFWIAAPIGTIFPGIHGGIHAVGLLTGHTHDNAIVDFFGVVIPGFLTLLIAVRAMAIHNKEDHS